ncbi:hypothetical protein G6F23_013784 [Rhizopus arrhizus]|nr:hypothetical protein G6F23_013784 [Rhizopus arrhizus]
MRPARSRTATGRTCPPPADAPAAGAATARPANAREPPRPGPHPADSARQARTTSTCRAPTPVAARARPGQRRGRSSATRPAAFPQASLRPSWWFCHARPAGGGGRWPRIRAAPSPTVHRPARPGLRPLRRRRTRATTLAPARTPDRCPAWRSYRQGSVRPR